MKMLLQRILRYNPCDIIGDAIAGLTVGLVAIPQSMLLAAYAGIPFEYALYPVLLGLVLYLFLGRSKHVIISSSPLFLGLISMYLRSDEEWIPQKAIVMTFVSGTLVILAAVLSAGRLVNRLSSFVLAGFVWANVMTITTNEVFNMLGIRHGYYQTNDFLSVSLLSHIYEAEVWDCVLSVCCIILLLALLMLRSIQISPEDKKPRTIHKIMDRIFRFLSNISGALVLLLTAGIAYHFHEEESSISPFALTFSTNSTLGFPMPTIPPLYAVARTDSDWRLMVVPPLLTPVLTIVGHAAVLRALSDGEETMTGWELSSFGFINLVGSFFSCAPLVADFSNSSINSFYGARSRLSGFFAALVVVLCMSGLTTSFHAFIPRAAVSSVILFALYHLLKGITLVAMREHNRARIIGGITTFLMGTFFCMEYGLLVGIMVDITICAFTSHKAPVIAEKLQSPAGIPYILVSSNADTKLPTVAMYQEAVSRNKAVDEENMKYMTVVIDCKHITLANLNTAHGVYLLMEYFRNKKITVIFHNMNIDVAKAFSSIFPPDFLHSTSETHLRRLFRGMRIEEGKKSSDRNSESQTEKGIEVTEDTNC